MDHTNGGAERERRTGWSEGKCLGFLKWKKLDTDVIERFAAQEELLIHSVKFGEDVWMFPNAQT